MSELPPSPPSVPLEVPPALAPQRTLAGQLALVTGATRGIGRTIAQVLGGAGAVVVGTATTPEGAERISAQLRAAGIAGRGAVWNAGEAGAAEALAADLQTAEGLPSILVNNAGIAHDALIVRMKSEDWDQTLSVNLSAVFRLTKLCVRRMLRERQGRIINIGSVVGSIGNAGQVHYAAAKAGLIGFTKALARELAMRSITVNTVAPGFIETDMTRNLPEAQRAAYLAQIPMGRFGSADEVAQTVLFLTSSEAGYITGQTLHVTGGMYMG